MRERGIKTFSTFLSCFFLSCSAQAANVDLSSFPGEIVEVINGTLVAGGSTWSAPGNSIPPTVIRTGPMYFASSLMPGAPGRYVLHAHTMGLADPALYLYQNSFNPNTPLANILIGDDDTGGQFGTSLDAAFVFSLEPNTPYYAVVSTYSTNQTGAYTLTIKQLDNQTMTWQGVNDAGTTDPTVWGYSNRNWTDGRAIIPPDNAYSNNGRIAIRQFATGDRVIFNDTGSVNIISVIPSGVTVSDMIVTGTKDYTFSGGSITGDESSVFGATLTGATGSLQKNGTGALTFANNASFNQLLFTGGKLVVNGSLSVENGGEISSDLFGSGAFNLNGGELVLNHSADNFLGTFNANAGSLLVKNNGGSFAGDLNIAAGAQAVFNDGNPVVQTYAISGDVANAGEIVLAGAAVGNTLHIVGDHIGNNGDIILRTTLGDDASPTDKLRISGAMSGATGLTIINAGGIGARTTGNGIKIIEAVGSATSTSDAFFLRNPVAAGAYNYELFFGGITNLSDQSWYLQTTKVRDKIVTDEEAAKSISSRSSAVAVSILGGFNDILSDISPENSVGRSDQTTAVDLCSGPWSFGHISGTTGSGNSSGSSSDYHRMDALAGSNLYRSRAGSGCVRTGFFAGFGQFSSTIDNDVSGARTGTVDTTAYSLGLYTSYTHDSGWFADAALMSSWIDIDTGNPGASKNSTNGTAQAVSFEGGKEYRLDHSFVLTPSTQLIYQHASIDDSSDSVSITRFDDTNSVFGRLGARLSYITPLTQTQETLQRFFKAYLKANLWHQFDATSRVNVYTPDNRLSGSFSSKLESTWGELGLGAESELSSDVRLFGNVGYQGTFDGNDDSYTGKIGVKFTW